MLDAAYDPSVPFESLRDWVSYGDAVVVATVSDEVPLESTDELGAMGWPGGQSIVIDDRVWQHSAAPVPPDTIEFDSGLLVVEPGDRPELTLRLASVGRQYLLALGRYDDDGWAPVAPMLEILDGRVDPNVVGTYPFADAFAGLDIAEIAAILSDTAPHEDAEVARPADPAARFATTIDPDTPATTAPSTTASSPYSTAPASPPTAPMSTIGLPGPPDVSVRNGGTTLELEPWTYCYQAACADGFPPDPLPSVGSGDQLDVMFPLEGWTFDATFQRAGDPCARTQTIGLQRGGPTSFVLGPAGPAGTYTIELLGRGDGDLIVSFEWTTTVEGPMPEPEAYIGVLADNDGQVDSYGVELFLSNLATTPTSSAATITVTAANGRSLTFDPRPGQPARGDCPVVEGTATWYGPDRRGLEATQLGPPPFIYDVVVTLDGVEHRAHAVWPDDEIPDEEPYVALDFEPALPALAD